MLTRRSLLATLAAGPFAAAQQNAQQRKPNIVVLLGDDMGYHDISLHGSTEMQTPHIDSIAKNGVRCTNGYVSGPYCSPTRAGFMTGRYQTRFGHEFNEGPGRTFGLALTETTIAQRLKDLGYATYAVGKWHLGRDPEYRPMRRGFDEFFGTVANTSYYHPPQFVDSRVSPDAKRVEDPAFYTTREYAKRCTEIIEANKNRPFFLYMAWNAVHAPSEAPQETLDRFKNASTKLRGEQAAITAEMDDGIGKILAKLRELKLEENTLIFFLSDNGGPQPGVRTDNTPFKGYKSSTWEGGVRVPFLVQWKGKLPAGKVYDQPVIQLDIQPTALAAAGGKVKKEWKLDGVDLLPHLTGKTSAPPHETLYWRFGPQWAIRKGDWKLVQASETKLLPPVALPKIPVGPVHLYNLAKDQSETNDLSEQHPEKVKELRAAWEAWNRELVEPAWLPTGPAAGQKKKKA
ncbi:MAG: sulfatase-like hydrolase/transferase [Bryobacteraceae bacterium]|nr:sulfatase-like hydrolase/transferase [Bryobacteraceae bacterium]